MKEWRKDKLTGREHNACSSGLALKLTKPIVWSGPRCVCSHRFWQIWVKH